MRSFLSVTLVSTFLCFCSVNAATWIVDQSGSGDATTIQEGIDLASHGDTVLVNPGTYSDRIRFDAPWGERVANFVMKAGVSVISADGPAETVIDGVGPAPYNVFVPQNVEPDCLLEGFTLRGSLTGVYVYKSSPTIRGNLFKHHRFEAVQMREASPHIISNTVAWVGEYGIRGHMYSTPVVRRNIVVNGGYAGIYCPYPGTVVECNNAHGNGVDFLDCGDDPTNFSEDPLFCDLHMGDYRLDVASPCTPEHSPTGCGLIGAFASGCGVVAVDEAPIVTPTNYLTYVLPNPFAGLVRIGYATPEGVPFTLGVYDIAGRELRSFRPSSSTGAVTWDGTTAGGMAAAVGTYYIRLRVGEKSETTRVVLMR